MTNLFLFGCIFNRIAYVVICQECNTGSEKMGVIPTDKWLLKFYEHPIKMCEILVPYFKGTAAGEIYQYLRSFGMYRPLKNGRKVIEKLQRNKVWTIIEQQYNKLLKEWSGPKTNVFIFPSDSLNRQIQRDFNGKSGLAFHDKIFLFLSEENEEIEMRALFTHEYNHVCRMAMSKKTEEEYILLDSVIMEGLAESAVKELMGERYVASWTTYYKEEQLKKIWLNIIKPNLQIPKQDRRHRNILYGQNFYPKMGGYCTGYYLVQHVLKNQKLNTKDLLSLESEKILQLFDH
jgi:uncharacterized protein YjaZ